MGDRPFYVRRATPGEGDPETVAYLVRHGGDPADPETGREYALTREEARILYAELGSIVDPRSPEDQIAAWRQWYREACSAWNAVDDIEAALRGDDEVDDA